jgi:hypothetical protein
MVYYGPPPTDVTTKDQLPEFVVLYGPVPVDITTDDADVQNDTPPANYYGPAPLYGPQQ